MFESWRLVLQCGARLLLLGGAISYSALTPALGLGDITLHSALNQPLSADIALVDVGGLEEGELSVSLATADEFNRAGVERVLFLNNLKFTPILRGNRSVIRVTSSKMVKEPYLDFVVQLNQPNGRLLREYTVLIDPPDAEEVDPVADEPVAEPPSSGFPAVQPANASSNPIKEPASTPVAAQPVAAPVSDPVVAEQLAASVLQNQQLQKTVDELNAKLTAQDEQIAGQKKQVTELQTRLAELKPAATETATPVAVVVEEPQASNGWLIIGLLALVALALLGLILRRHRRQQALALPKASPDLPSPPEPMLDPAGAIEENCLQGAGFDPLKLQDLRASHPKPNSAAPLVVVPVNAMSNDEYQLNLDDVSMDSSWDLVSPFDSSPSLDDGFLDEFSNAGQSLELEPLNLKLKDPT
ncbi:type IV pilus assembly protein FimV [Pseudomonas sp. CLCA07]